MTVEVVRSAGVQRTHNSCDVTSRSAVFFPSPCVATASVPRESLGTVRTNVGFLHAALVRAHVITHAVFPLEALLADGAGVGLLVRVRQAVAVEVVHVSEGFSTGLARVVLPHLVGV